LDLAGHPPPHIGVRVILLTFRRYMFVISVVLSAIPTANAVVLLRNFS
jgi:hypothetical protein